jgi:MFS family permease
VVVEFVKELRAVWRRQTSSWKTVVIRQVFNRFFSQLTMQYASIYIHELGASPVELGAVNSASGFASAVISLPLGWMRDRYSIRKIYVIGVGLITLVSLLYFVAYSWQFIAFAILIGGFAMSLGSCVVICDLSLPNKDRATGKALCEGIGALPTLFAPSVAAFLITWFGGINTENIRLLYGIQLVARVGLFLYVAARLTEIAREKRDEHRSVINGFKKVFQQGTTVKRWLLFLSVGMFTGNMMTAFRYPYAYEVKGATTFILSGIATASILTEAAFSTPFGRIADKIGRKKTFYLLTPFFCSANLLFALTPAPIYLLLAGFLLGFRMMAGVVVSSITPELMPREYLGRWRGVLGLFSGLAAIPAPVIGGLIWEHMGPEWVFIIPTLIELTIRLPLLYTVPETLNNPTPQPNKKKPNT